MTLMQYKMNTKIAPIYLVASEFGLQGLYWQKQSIPLLKKENNFQTIILSKAQQQLHEYFIGKRKKFDLLIDIKGTDFQKSVWNKLGEIPYGKTCSYKDIARLINNENAVRAVGTANGKNPLSIIIPCHRVISSDGSLGGYASGLDIKIKLLAHEQQA